jgi:anti-sigma regulatory factor (Ser/Thr protein kinase)
VNGAGITDLMSRVVAASTEPPARISLPGTPESVSAARRFVAGALPGCPRADDLILAVSELVSNSVAHSASGHGGAIVVLVRTVPRWARIDVTDDGPASVPRGRLNGWGLQIVAGIADRSGATVEVDGRRTAWAEVTWTP